MDAASLLSFRNATQTALETLFPAQITIGAQTIAAAVHGRAHTLKLREEAHFAGGFVSDFDIVFRFRRDAVTAVPLPETKITYQGAQYRIYRVYDDPSDPAVHIRCGAVDK